MNFTLCWRGTSTTHFLSARAPAVCPPTIHGFRFYCHLFAELDDKLRDAASLLEHRLGGAVPDGECGTDRLDHGGGTCACDFWWHGFCKARGQEVEVFVVLVAVADGFQTEAGHETALLFVGVEKETLAVRGAPGGGIRPDILGGPVVGAP